MTNDEASGGRAENWALGGLSLAAVTLGLIAFPLGFNLGAYDVIFYEDVMKVVVAAMVLFAVTFFASNGRPLQTWLFRVVLVSLPLWFVAAAVFEGSTGEAMEKTGYQLWLAASLVISVPLTLKLMVDMFTPEVRRLRNQRVMILVAVVSLAGVIGYIAGHQHARLLTCNDFAVAGSSEPDGCAR
ncbi:MAG: hypothetical protein ACR2PK_05060 [Acidimicrobiales bacterium]